MGWLFEPAPQPSLAIAGSELRFPVRRIWCVGRNYAGHVREMGGDPQRDPPFFFAKPADALVEAPQLVEEGHFGEALLPYPPQTRDFHHEVELVVALASGGKQLTLEQATAAIAGYAVGLDMTRRDVQARAKHAGQPWEMAKAFDHSAVCSAIQSVAAVGHPRSGVIELSVNGELRQRGDLRDLIWSVPEVVAYLSQWVEVRAGDLIYSGTPEGVGPVLPGDLLTARIAGVTLLQARVIQG